MKRAISRFVMAAAIAALVVGGVTSVLAQSPNFTNFSSTAGLSLNGSAAQSGNTVLRLTDTMPVAEAGSAWFNTPQPFANGFDTTFTFQLTGGSGADGIAFVIQNAPSPLSARGYVGQGGPLGYGGDDGVGNQGIPSSVAIEFDTYQNGWDPNSGHIAVQSCGALANTSHHAPLTCPGSTINPTIGITPASTVLALTGSVHTVQIHYAAPTATCAVPTCKNLTITLDPTNTPSDVPVLSVSVDLTSLIGSVPAYVGFTGATGGSNNNQDIQSWTFTSTTVVTGTPIDTGSGANLSQTSVLNPTTNQQVAYNFDFSAPFTAGHLTFPDGVSSITPLVGFTGITQTQWKTLVHGTALADTLCLTAAGLTDSSGNHLCLVNSLTATTNQSPTPSGSNLPQSSARDIVLTQTLDIFTGQGSPIGPGSGSNFQLGIPGNTAPGMAEFNDSGACQFPDGDPLAGELCPRSILTSIQDGPTKLGGTPKPAGSTQIFFCCEREWTTAASVPLWNNTTSVPVSFTSTPPSAPTGDSANGWVPAPALGVLFGAKKHSDAAPDPVLPNFKDQLTAVGAPSCPVPGPTNVWGGLPTPVVFGSNGTLLKSVDPTGKVSQTLAEGAYDLLYALQDCDEFLALGYPSSIVVNGPEVPGNLATWPSVPFNIDTTKPTVGAITLNPSGGYYLQNAPVKASFSCSDPISGGVASGIASCGSSSGFNGLNPANVVNAPVTTSTIGSFSYTASATDLAGNSAATPSSVPYTVAGQADLSIGMIGNILVKNGQNVTYLIGVANKGPNPAYTVVVNDILPAGTSLVSAGFAIDSCSFGSGAPPSCTIVPPKTACSGTSCNIGTLPAWVKGNPIGALIQITVKVNTGSSSIKNTATVAGVPGADSSSSNNSASWGTLVTH